MPDQSTTASLPHHPSPLSRLTRSTSLPTSTLKMDASTSGPTSARYASLSSGCGQLRRHSLRTHHRDRASDRCCSHSDDIPMVCMMCKRTYSTANARTVCWGREQLVLCLTA